VAVSGTATDVMAVMAVIAMGRLVESKR
jgi:hypothetical protein